MALFCAADDFMLKTLKAVPGAWGKLRYVAGLRGSDGLYHHWGLTRVYGEAATQRTIGDAHRAMLLEVLRMPVRALLSDAQQSAAAREEPLTQFLKELSENVEALLPPAMGGGSERHFNSVLQALVSLARTGRVPSRRVS